MSFAFQVTLVRHGQTAANKARIIQGNADVPLSDVGRDQAKKLGAHFKETETSFTHVYASDLSRALETCQLIVGNSEKITTDKRLRERAFGIVEGKTIASYRAAAREAGYKEKELSYFTPEGGETLEQVNQRVKQFFSELVSDHLKGVDRAKVLIVTHGGVIREYMKFFRDECKCDFNGINITIVTPNTGVNVFNISSAPGGKVIVEMVKINDTTHLGDNPESIEPANPIEQSTNSNDITPPLDGF